MSGLAHEHGVLLRAEGLSKSYGRQRVLNRVSLELRSGDVTLLSGDNGAGKTTLLNILTGSLAPDAGSITYFTSNPERRYRFSGGRRFLDGFTPEGIVDLNVSRSWQDVRLFGGHSVRDNIALANRRQPGENPLRVFLTPGRCRRTEDGIAASSEALLVKLHLAHKGENYADSISLGESKRVAIARAVAAGAKVLFLDEPFAGLDSDGARVILQLLEELIHEKGLTLIIVEHGPARHHLRRLVTTEWLLRDGELEVRASGAAEKRDARDELVGALERLAGPSTDFSLGKGAVLRRFRVPERYLPSSTPALEVEGLVVSRGRRAVLGREGQLQFALDSGEIGVLEAYNGWGKSTLLGAISGILPIQSGTVCVAGMSVCRLEPWQRVAQGLQFLPAGGFDFPNLSLHEVSELATRRPEASREDRSERYVSTLSGGEARKIAIRALGPAQVTLLDEPLSRLDETERDAAIKRLLRSDLGALLITIPSDRG